MALCEIARQWVYDLPETPADKISDEAMAKLEDTKNLLSKLAENEKETA